MAQKIWLIKKKIKRLKNMSNTPKSIQEIRAELLKQQRLAVMAAHSFRCL